MNDETVRVLSWNGFSELLQGPFRRRMSRHIAVHNPACPDFDEHKHVEDAKGRRYDHEEIACQRLIDSLAEGVIDKDQFTSRMNRTKARIADIDEKIGTQAADEERRTHVRSVMNRLAELSTHLQSQLNNADWVTKREIVRALVQRIEIGPTKVAVVLRLPMGRAPELWSRLLSHCPECEISAEGHVAANQHPVTTGHRQPHAFVVRVADPNREAATMHLGLQVQHTEHLHTVR
jgi:hypothetical protein